MRLKNKFLLFTLAAALTIPNMSLLVYADDSGKRARIVVENNTFSKADGAAWEGTLIDEWVNIDGVTPAADLFEKTLSEHGYTQTGAKDNYVTEINGLSAGADQAGMGGWMTGYDDWYGNGGITTLSLDDGDELFLSYSLNWGVDIGSDYTSLSTKLTSLTADKGKLSPEFSADTTEYVLELPSDANSVCITPTAENKSYRYKIYKNSYSPDDDSADYKRTDTISVSNGDVLYVGVGHAGWHSYMPDGVTETVYTITVAGSDSEVSDTDSVADTDTSNVPSVTDTDKISSDLSVDSMITAVHSDMTPANNNYLPGDEWVLLTNCRLGLCTAKDAENYLAKLNDALKSDPPKRATDYAKYTLVLTALGENPTEWNNINMLSELSDLDFAAKQGINGLAYALLAFDSKNYEIPAAEKGKEQTTREKLISAILDAQLNDGGWAYFGDVYEPDMTGIVLQALAPYYGKNFDVTNAVDRALKLLSENQNTDGTYTSYGEPNAENSAQIIIALSALGIDADKDARFIKGDSSVLDGLKAFWVSDNNGFAHSLNGEKNALSTIQSYEALCAYKLFSEKKPAFYDMNSVSVTQKDDSDTSKENTSSNGSKNNSSAASQSNTTNNSNTTPVATGDNGNNIVLLIFALSFAAFIVYKKEKSI